MKNENLYVGMRPGDLEGKPYAKFYNPNMAPLSDHTVKAIAHGPHAPQLGFPVSECARLLEPGYLPLENGFTQLSTGQTFVASLTQFPRCEGKEFDWWMAWMTMEPQRYKLWHPHSHMSCQAERLIADDPNLPEDEKRLYNRNFTYEYIGNQVFAGWITHYDPAEFFDPEELENSGTTAIMCGPIGPIDKPDVCTGMLFHQFRKTEYGCEQRSRYWMGGLVIPEVQERGIMEQFIAAEKQGPVKEAILPVEFGALNLAHDGMEFPHLASFLPDLYAMYHPNGHFEPNPKV